MRIIVSKKDIEEVIQVSKKYLRLDLTKTQAKAVFKDKHFAGNYYTSGIDTYVREILTDHFAQKFTKNLQWPVNCDSDKYQKKFYKQYLAGAKKLGYKLIDEESHQKKIHKDCIAGAKHLGIELKQ